MNRQIIIEVDLKDNASGKSLEGFKRSLVEFDKQTQKTRQRLLSLGRSAYKAEVRLIDKISPQGAKINEMLRRLAATQYKVGVSITNKTFAQITNITTALQRISGRAWPITLKLRDDLTSKIKSLKGMIDGMLLGFGSMGLMGGAGGIGYGLASGLSAYADFEKMSSKVAAVRGLSKNSPEMLALIEQAKQLGMTTQFTRTEAMQSAFYAALAGFDTQSILKFVPHTLNLASAGDLELGRASDILSDTATAFGIKPGQFYTDKKGRVIEMLEGYTDMLAKIQSISNTDISTAYEGLKYSAPVLAAIGTGKSNEYKMQVAEDALIASGILSDFGIKGSSAGTTLRAVFSRFSGENRNALFGLRAMGVEVQRGGEMLTPGEIIQNLRRRVEEGIPVEHLTDILESFAGERIHQDTRRKLDSFLADTIASGGKIKSAQLMKMGSMLAGQEAMSGLLALMTSGDSWSKKAAEMDNAHGFAASAAKTQLDNLAGSVTYLESAFDSLRQSMWEGQAGSGIRAFVDNLTELMTRANNLFKDGIDIPDLGKIAMDAVDRLKNKFVELDGVGSLLSGGVLMAGLTKIGKLVQKTIGYFRSLKGLQLGQILGGAAGAGAKGGTISSAAQVGTMNVTAGVVNIGGKFGGAGGSKAGTVIGGAPTSSATTSTGATVAGVSAIQAAQARERELRGRLTTFQRDLAKNQRAYDNSLARLWSSPGNARYAQQHQAAQVRLASSQAAVARAQSQLAQQEARVIGQIRTQSVMESYYARKEQAQLAQAAKSARVANMFSAARGGATFAGLFGAMDYFNTKSVSEERVKEASDALRAARSEYDELTQKHASAELLSQHATKIQELESQRAQILQENKVAERDALAGATVSVLGAAIGAGLGSFVGPMGTMIGGAIGSVVGEALGHKINQIGEPKEGKPEVQFPASTVNRVVEESKMVAGFHARRATGGDATTEATQSRIVAAQERQAMVQEKMPELTNYGRILENQLSAMQFGTQFAVQDFYQQQAKQLMSQLPAQVIANQQKGWDLLHDMFGFGSTAHAATLSEEQLLQQAQMERPMGEAVAEATQPSTELTTPEPLDFSSITEQLYSDMEAFTEGINELFSGIGESISETLTTSFEGIGETFTGFTDSITENLTSALDGLSEYFSGFGEAIQSNLTATFENAATMFTGFGDNLTSTLTAAQASTETALTAIGTSFETTRTQIMTAWGELPSFFAGVFSGLGGAAQAAGAAIYSGLTAPIGQIIGAWQSAAAQISSIISSISAQAASIPSVNISAPAGKGFAEGGFVSSEMHFFAGEHGAEVIIPLSTSKRSRALDLFEKTAAILGHGASIPTGDLLSNISNIPELPANFGNNFKLDAQEIVSAPVSTGSAPNKIEINLGGVNGTTFEIRSGNPREVLDVIRDNFATIANKLTERIAEQVSDAFNNMAVRH